MQADHNNSTDELITLVVSEWTLQSTNHWYTCIIVFAYPLGVQKSLFCFCTKVSFWVTAIDYDEGIYGQSLNSEYAFFIQHKSIHGRLTILWEIEMFMANKWAKFNFVHPCIGKLWLVVEAPLDLFPMACVQITLFDQLSIAVSPWWLNLKGC